MSDLRRQYEYVNAIDDLLVMPHMNHDSIEIDVSVHRRGQANTMAEVLYSLGNVLGTDPETLSDFTRADHTNRDCLTVGIAEAIRCAFYCMADGVTKI